MTSRLPQQLRRDGLKWLFWLICAGVSVLALLPTQKLPNALFDIWDKAQHALAFAVLCAIGLRAYRETPWRAVTYLAGLGALIEVAQWASGWRQGDASDWLADMVGVAVVCAVASIARTGRSEKK